MAKRPQATSLDLTNEEHSLKRNRSDYESSQTQQFSPRSEEKEPKKPKHPEDNYEIDDSPVEFSLNLPNDVILNQKKKKIIFGNKNS